GVPRVVFASSSSVYGSSATLPKKEGFEGLPLSPYALTKKINEEHSKLFKDLYGLDTVGLRYFNVYGPRQDPNSEYAAVIPRFVTRLLAGVSPVIYGTGLQSRDFTFVKDVVKANLMSMEAPTDVCGASYNVGRGDQINLLELLDNLKDLLGKRIEPVFEPTRPGDVMHSSADISLAREKLGFQAKWELRKGLEASIGYYAKTSAS
ncbi:MAG: NAD-dependent epimerase/dehydratase family protein, partial [Syntrophaceae bacterium]|nr:NAD-dependent epimerase/dehydratase family protein [Syntrophaceae bacterium]